jgi:hypothetical protein
VVVFNEYRDATWVGGTMDIVSDIAEDIVELEVCILFPPTAPTPPALPLHLSSAI